MKVDTLLKVVEHSASEYPNKVALHTPDDAGATLTYTDLVEAVHTFKRELQTLVGTGLGDVVSIVLPNGLPFVISFLGVTAGRAIAAPLNAAYGVEEFAFYLEDTRPKAVLCLASEREHNARVAAKRFGIPVLDIAMDGCKVTLALAPGGGDVARGVPAAGPASVPVASDVALFLHTSGTTSRPKGVPLTHGNLTTSLANIVATYELTPSDVSLIIMPLFHVHGLLGATLSTLRSAGMLVVPRKFAASQFWNLVQTHGVTWYSAVPTIHQILLARAEGKRSPPHRLRFIRSCSSALAPVVLDRLEAYFGVGVLEAYGMTEASHQMSSNPLRKHGPRKAGSVGLPTNVDVAILDDKANPLPTGSVGEVCIRGNNVMHGYHNNPKANQENFTPNGWFRTGDQGFLDADGYLTLTGRLKELINRGGEKISPLELDGILLKCPGVGEAVCFAAPDEKYGEVVNAAIVPKKGATVTETQVIDFCKGKMVNFKVPSRVFISDHLPRTATGKIQRRKVAAHFLKPSKL